MAARGSTWDRRVTHKDEGRTKGCVLLLIFDEILSSAR